MFSQFAENRPFTITFLFEFLIMTKFSHDTKSSVVLLGKSCNPELDDVR